MLNQIVKRAIKPLVPKTVLQQLDEYQFSRRYPHVLRRIQAEGLDRLAPDPGAETAIGKSLRWLCRAQDGSLTRDGGVSRHYGLREGWAASYPETTGYIIPTFLAESTRYAMLDLSERARRMLDWFTLIQFPEGGFQGGLVTHEPRIPVTFNTGQILLGLASGAAWFGEEKYLDAMHRAARWLAATQDADGCWRKFPTPFAAPGEKTYETHVSWGLFEAERVARDCGYREVGLKQVRWALRRQTKNGWFHDCCLNDCNRPLTHTIGYALRGILEAYRSSNERSFLDAAVLTGEAVMQRLGEDGSLAGRFDREWRPAVKWNCLTGSLQIAHCWLLLFEFTDEQRFLQAAKRANAFVRRTALMEGDPGVAGGIKGSHPISGGYGQYQYLNWATKFFVDSNRKELDGSDVSTGHA